MNQTLPKKTTKYRVFIVDHYCGTQSQLPQIFDSWPAAQDAINKYFLKTPPQTVTDYDIGGYIERVQLDLAYNPKTDEVFDEPEKS